MKSKYNLMTLLFIAILVILSACGNNSVNNSSHAILSMDELRVLAQKGEDLIWKDFEAYSFEDIGSGLYIRKYEIDEDYHLLVGGGSIDTAPMYINLVKTNKEKIDIRYDDIDHFISSSE